MSTCPNCGYCKECGRSNAQDNTPTHTIPLVPDPYAPQIPFPSTWYCYRCGRQHGMYEVCPNAFIWSSGSMSGSITNTSQETKP